MSAGGTWRTAYKGLVRLARRVPVDDDAARGRLFVVLKKNFEKGARKAARGGEGDGGQPAAPAGPDTGIHVLAWLEEALEDKRAKRINRKSGSSSMGEEASMVFALASGSGNSVYRDCVVDELKRKATERVAALRAQQEGVQGGASGGDG